MSQKNLDAVVTELKNLEIQERKLEDDVLERLAVIFHQRYFLKLGYPTLFDFCTKELGYSAGKASRRISAIKCIDSLDQSVKDQVKEKLKQGALTLTHLAQLQSVSRQKKLPSERKLELLAQMTNTTTRESEKILVQEFGAQVAVKESYRPVSETEVKVSLLLDQETLDLLEKFKGLVAHQNPQGSTSHALKLALQAALKQKDPVLKGRSVCAQSVASAPNSCETRKVAQAQPTRARVARGTLRSLVWKRDQGRCQYASPTTGRKCDSAYQLEVDHILPYSRGGKTELANLRLLCRAHNQARVTLRIPRGSSAGSELATHGDC